ncbi:hypothetical protein ATANTOWER_019505 [Ataeniobius toweri]|uniref:DUF1088 domain-containing protein n=1 Tax=Ataeniobius toweri TaxID=208326 RepID=A0ABU7BII4_9TELE|nr:hypothetical protein [Ataeniobius toweri]
MKLAFSPTVDFGFGYKKSPLQHGGFGCLGRLDTQSTCAQYAAEKRDEEKMCDHLIRAAKFRDHMTSTQLIQKIINILTDKHGAWGNSSIR